MDDILVLYYNVKQSEQDTYAIFRTVFMKILEDNTKEIRYKRQFKNKVITYFKNQLEDVNCLVDSNKDINFKSIYDKKIMLYKELIKIIKRIEILFNLTKNAFYDLILMIEIIPNIYK